METFCCAAWTVGCSGISHFINGTRYRSGKIVCAAASVQYCTVQLSVMKRNGTADQASQGPSLTGTSSSADRQLNTVTHTVPHCTRVQAVQRAVPSIYIRTLNDARVCSGYNVFGSVTRGLRWTLVLYSTVLHPGRSSVGVALITLCTLMGRTTFPYDINIPCACAERSMTRIHVGRSRLLRHRILICPNPCYWRAGASVNAAGFSIDNRLAT